MRQAKAGESGKFGVNARGEEGLNSGAALQLRDHLLTNGIRVAYLLHWQQHSSVTTTLS